MCGKCSMHGFCVYILFIHLAPGIVKVVFLLLRPRLRLILITDSDLSMSVFSGVSFPQMVLHCTSMMCSQLDLDEAVYALSSFSPSPPSVFNSQSILCNQCSLDPGQPFSLSLYTLAWLTCNTW